MRAHMHMYVHVHESEGMIVHVFIFVCAYIRCVYVCLYISGSSLCMLRSGVFLPPRRLDLPPIIVTRMLYVCASHIRSCCKHLMSLQAWLDAQCEQFNKRVAEPRDTDAAIGIVVGRGRGYILHISRAFYSQNNCDCMQ